MRDLSLPRRYNTAVKRRRSDLQAAGLGFLIDVSSMKRGEGWKVEGVGWG